MNKKTIKASTKFYVSLSSWKQTLKIGAAYIFWGGNIQFGKIKPRVQHN